MIHRKKIFRKKKKIPAARVVLFGLTRPTGNDFLLKGGLRKFVLEDGDLQLKKTGGSQRNLRG